MALLGVPLQELAEIGQFVAGVASLVVVASVYFVWKQVKQQAEDSRTELITGMTTLIISVSRIFIEYPYLRQYFHDGVAPTVEHVEQTRAVAVTLADAIDHVAAHLCLMDEPVREAWEAYIGDMRTSSPVLMNYLRTHRHWYGPKLRQLLEID